MYPQAAQTMRHAEGSRHAAHAAGASGVSTLTDAHMAEALDFLARRPLHTVFLSSLVLDNGLSSPLNRGTFYAYRNVAGELEGIALIGHAILLETHTEASTAALARVAQNFSAAHIVLGESAKIESFWRHYSEGGQAPRLFAREILFEQKWPVEMHAEISQLRLATQADLPLILPVHAQMAFDETGVNPLDTDPEGFRRRTARRIEQGRVWVLVEGNRLIFKADIISATPQVNYLEGVYVAPAERGRGYGLRCLSQLTRRLLAQTKAVTLLVNERNHEAVNFYRQAGYKPRSCYDTIVLKK